MIALTCRRNFGHTVMTMRFGKQTAGESIDEPV